MSVDSKVFERGGMYLLVMMPFYATVTQFFVKEPLLCFVCLTAVTLIGGFIAFLPKFVGSYSEIEVIRYEGGINRGADPNPDRESRHETVREGRRFPLRIPAGIVAFVLTLVLLILLPQDAYTPGNGVYRFGFIALTLAFEVVCMGSLNLASCLWTELPGIAIGFLGYLAAALYLRFGENIDSTFALALGVCALMFLFGGFVCLNRASLSGQSSADGDKRGIPKMLEKRNRRVVLIFASLIAIVSFVPQVRSAALWLLRWIVVGFRWLAWLLRGGREAEKGDLNRILAMQGFYEEEGMLSEEEIPPEEVPLEEITSTVWDKVFVYIFIGILAFGILFIIYYHATKKLNRDGFLFKRRKKSTAEGYYDEKESLDSSEVRKKYSRLRDRFRSAFAREPSWDRLNGREKARRLVKQLYRRRQNGVENIKNLTAKEALEKMKLKPEAADKTVRAYDTARYSEHEVDGAKMDELKKELRL